MGPPSYFVKIRKRTIASLPPPLSPTPLPHTLTPFPWQTDTNYATLDLVEALNWNYTTSTSKCAWRQSTFRIHHVLSRTLQQPTWQWTINKNLTSTNLKTQYLILVLHGTAVSTKERTTEYQYFPSQTNYFILVTTIQTILQRHCRSSTDHSRHLISEKAEY